MKIPLKAKIICKDGEYGSIKELLIDPIKEKATHIVIENKHNSMQVILPVDELDYTSDTVITLDKTASELDKSQPFIIHEFIKVPNVDQEVLYWGVDPVMSHTYTMFPYVMHDGKPTVEVTREDIPSGEFKITRGMSVIGSENKKLGKIDELIIEKNGDLISHIVMRTGHLFGKREVAVPSINIVSYNKDSVTINIGQNEISLLPEVLIKRAWQ